MVRLLLFDIDHTLINSGGAGRSAMAAALAAELGGDPLDGVVIDGRTDRAILNEALGRAGADTSDAEIDRLLLRYLDCLPETLRSSAGRVLPGVRDLLDALAGEDAAVGLATGNVRRGAEIKLRHYGLWERFSDGGFGDVSSDRTEVVRAGVEAVAIAAGVAADPAHALVLGDTPRDVEAAHAAGVRAIAVATGAYDVETLRGSGADAVLADFTETAVVLEMLLD